MTNPLHLTSAPRPDTEKAANFRAWSDEVRNMLDGQTPEDQVKSVLANQEFVRGVTKAPQHTAASAGIGIVEKGITPAAVHVDALLTTFSKMYANSQYIGEQLMPVVPVSKRSDKYVVYPKRERFGYPDDEVGHRASPNELEQSREFDNYSVLDYGYKEFLDLESVQNEDAPLNEMLDLLDNINEGIAFRREKRILAIVGSSASYGSNTADATTEWNTASTGGTIVNDLLAARAALWRGTTATKIIGVCPITVWNSGIANNPDLLDKFKFTQSGLAVTTQIARMFQLDDILITEAREETANEGQTAAYARMMTGDAFALLSVAQRPSLRSLHFGSTFRSRNDPHTAEWMDPSIGKRGGLWAKVTTSEVHKVVANEAGYLITDVLT